MYECIFDVYLKTVMGGLLLFYFFVLENLL